MIASILGIGFIVAVVGVTMVLSIREAATRALAMMDERHALDLGDLGTCEIVFRSKLHPEALDIWKREFPRLVSAWADELVLRGLTTHRRDLILITGGLQVEVRDFGELDVSGTRADMRWTGHLHPQTMWVSVERSDFPTAHIVEELEHGRDQIMKGLTWIGWQNLDTHFIDPNESRDIIAATTERLRS